MSGLRNHGSKAGLKTGSIYTYFLGKETYMRLIEHRGGCMSGYVPERPKSIRRRGEMLRLILIP